MRPIFYQFPPDDQGSFKVELDEGPYFYYPFHFHYELQLTLVLAGSGTRFVGDSIEPFGPGDLVLIGSNLPHVFRNDPIYYEKESTLRTRAISVFFRPDFLGREFMSLPELQGIRHLIQQAERGMVIRGDTRLWVSKRMPRLVELQGFSRLWQFVRVLQKLTQSPDLAFLSTSSGDASLTRADSDKLHRVFDFVMKHYAEEIRLPVVAELAHMSPTAFSRYFRRQTRKTFSQFLNEIRIGQAKKMLKEDRFSIAQVAYQCGFNNLSNFNRRFKTLTQRTPKGYREQYRR